MTHDDKDTPEVALAALAASGLGPTDGEVRQDCDRTAATDLRDRLTRLLGAPTTVVCGESVTPPAAPAGTFRIEDFDGDALVVEPNHAPNHVANIVTDVWVDGVREVAGVALTRDDATALRDHLTALLGDGPARQCGARNPCAGQEHQTCVSPAGHGGWHRSPFGSWPASADGSPDAASLHFATRVIRKGWHDARRWEDPMPLPAWVRQFRDVLGPAVECDCYTCRGADERAASIAEHRRILTATLAAECSTRGHAAADWCGCSRCGAALSTVEWQALVAAEVKP
jgi:hypothetical protein